MVSVPFPKGVSANFFVVLNKINYNIAWIEGFAIFVAVFVVSGVSTGVDYSKEQSFVKSRLASDANNIVSIYQNR
jgi:hypothetical protein